MAKSWILAIVCFFSLAMSAEATNRNVEKIVIRNVGGRQTIILKERAPQNDVTIIRRGLFGFPRETIRFRSR